MRRPHVHIVQSLVLAAGALATPACTARADNTPKSAPARTRTSEASKAPAASSGLSPEARGRAVLKAQLDALTSEEAFRATFAKQSVVLTPTGSYDVHATNVDIGAIIAFLNPHAEVKSVTFDHFSAGGNAQVAWFAAELRFTVVSREPGYPAATAKHVVRAIELLDGDADWKVAVASFTKVGPLQAVGTSTISDPTDRGPLVSLLLSPPALAGALGDAAVVFGTDPGERGIGTAEAKTLLSRWKKLTITLDPSSNVHETHTASYGYAMTNVRLVTKPGGEAYKLNAFVLALPRQGNAWSVIGASYGAVF